MRLIAALALALAALGGCHALADADGAPLCAEAYCH